MRCNRRLLDISYSDHVTNEEVSRKIQAAIGEYDELLTDPGQETETRMVWPCLKDFFGSAKTILQGTVKGQRKRDGKTISKGGQEWTLQAQLEQMKTGQDGQGLLRILLWCPGDLPRLWDRIV